jgi:hypothetical protein
MKLTNFRKIGESNGIVLAQVDVTYHFLLFSMTRKDIKVSRYNWQTHWKWVDSEEYTPGRQVEVLEMLHKFQGGK